LSYEAVGRYDEAIKQYSVFLNTWKNADEGIDEIDDAKDRLSKLRSGA